MRKEVETPDALNLVTTVALGVALHKNSNIAGLCVHVAADVDHSLWPKGKQLA